MINGKIDENVYEHGNDGIILEHSDERYREILREFGFDTCNSGPLTKKELEMIFICTQEDIFIGS